MEWRCLGVTIIHPDVYCNDLVVNSRPFNPSLNITQSIKSQWNKRPIYIVGPYQKNCWHVVFSKSQNKPNPCHSAFFAFPQQAAASMRRYAISCSDSGTGSSAAPQHLPRNSRTFVEKQSSFFGGGSSKVHGIFVKTPSSSVTWNI